MDKYLDSYREMISLRGLTDHTKKTTAPISGAGRRASDLAQSQSRRDSEWH